MGCRRYQRERDNKLPSRRSRHGWVAEWRMGTLRSGLTLRFLFKMVPSHPRVPAALPTTNDEPDHHPSLATSDRIVPSIDKYRDPHCPFCDPASRSQYSLLVPDDRLPTSASQTMGG